MTDWNAVSAFMANVVAWPGSPQDPGFVNLHYSMPDRKQPGKLLKGMGWPFTHVDKLVERAAWINTVPDKFKDVWFCTSLQSKMGNNSKGKPKAVRLAANALKVKAIWIDIDVGVSEPGKKPKYPDIQTALKAALAFARTVGLPEPSAVVFSGGGVHVYWISDKPLTPEEWGLYASGLKQLLLANNILCDTGLTTDIARILRVPGTFNHKYDPPAPVSLAPLPLVMYDFSAKLAFLQKFAGPVISPTKVPPSILADNVTFETFGKPHPLFDQFKNEPGLNAGIDKGGDNLLEPFPIFRQCGFLRDALTTAGKDYDQTLWMYSVLCSTFMEGGNEIAHKISSGHASYSKDDTQALYDRKLAERHDRGIGYPSCATVAGAGCEACKTCPLFAKGKSPLNIRPAPVTATVIPGVQSKAAQDSLLPVGYELNSENIICKVVETKDGDTLVTSLVPLFQSVLTGFWLQKDPGEIVNFTMTVDKGFTLPCAVPMGEISKTGFKSWLGDRRCLVHSDVTPKLLEGFFLSIIGKLRAMAAAQQSVPFGWYEEGDSIKGFAFGNKILLEDGTEKPCGSGDANIAAVYKPCGTIEKWLEGASTITDRHRPELTSILLMSFASPLLALAGKNSMMMAVFSPGEHSGAGKSSAYAIGMAVWGHPLLSKGTETQTANNITTTMKTIRNLPFYWDEITDDIQREKVAKVMHEADGGKEKGRNKDGERTQAAGQWKLMIHYASNGSYREYLRKRNPNHVASLVRVLEWEVQRINGLGVIKNADAELKLAALQRNYGMMGMKYAKFLAMNHKVISEEVRLKCNEVENVLSVGAKNGLQTERYWTTAVAIMSLAAKYAQQMGLDVEPQEIETFMYKVYQENLKARDEFSFGVIDDTESVLARYLKERYAQERGIWTNYMHTLRGKPPKPVRVIQGPTAMRNMQGGVEFRFAIENRVLVIAQKDFNIWLAGVKQAETQVYAALKLSYGLELQRLQLGSGFAETGRENCLVLHIGVDSPLWGFMTDRIPPEEKAKMEAGEPPEEIVVETGIEVPVDGA